MRNRAIGRHITMNYVDILKLSVLLLLYVVCFHSSVVKFAPSLLSSYASTPEARVNRDYSLCNKITSCDTCENKDALKSLCSTELSSGYYSVENDKCKGYVKNLSTCLQSQSNSRSGCRIEQNNLDGCSSSVMKELLTRWSSPESITL